MPYPTVPGRRIAWDDDGTVAVLVSQNSTVPGQAAGIVPAVPFAAMSTPTKQSANSEDSDVAVSLIGGGTGNNLKMVACLIFPELRDIDGYYINKDGTSSSWLYSAPDTTNGRDGTWSPVGSQIISAVTTFEAYRESINSAALTGVRGISFGAAGSGTGSGAFLRRLHYYGEIAAGETPDRLLFMDETTGLEFAVDMDYGDIARGSARDFEMRLKNNSMAAGNNVTINSIPINVEALFGDSPAWYTFSIGGDAFQSTKNISSLAPEASSSLIVVRQVIDVNAVLGLHAARIQAGVGSLS